MAEAQRLADIEALRAAQEAAGALDENVFEEGNASKEERTAHHIRANSSIMHLNKLLGELMATESAASPITLPPSAPAALQTVRWLISSICE